MIDALRQAPPGPDILEFEGVGGLRLVADAWGDAAAPGVLFLHGGGQTRHAWSVAARALAHAGLHAVALDLRGHGDSDWSADGDYTLETFVGDLVRVADRMAKAAGRRPAVVGASLGGLAGLLAEGEIAPGTASRLVLVDIAHRAEDDGVERILEFMTGAPDGFASIEEAADAVARYVPHRPRPTNVDGLRKNLRQRPDGRYAWHWDPAFLEGRLHPGVVRSAERLAAAARGLRLPTLLVRGGSSDVLSEAGARDFLALAPDAQFVDVTGAGHMVAGDDNDAFTEAISEFLKEG